MISHSMTLAINIEEVGRVATELDEFGTHEGLPRRTILDLQLALEEILTNVISYAFEGGDSASIDVQWDVQDSRINITVSDNGRPFNPLKFPEAETGQPPEERPVGGLGIFLARKKMDGIEYSRQNNQNVLTLWKTWRESNG